MNILLCLAWNLTTSHCQHVLTIIKITSGQSNFDKRPHRPFASVHGRYSYTVLHNGPLLPHRIAPSHGDGNLDPDSWSNTWFLGSTGIHTPISIGSAVFTGLTIVTNRPTDRPRYAYSVCNNRLHLPSTYAVLRCGLKADYAASHWHLGDVMVIKYHLLMILQFCPVAVNIVYKL